MWALVQLQLLKSSNTSRTRRLVAIFLASLSRRIANLHRHILGAAPPAVLRAVAHVSHPPPGQFLAMPTAAPPGGWTTLTAPLDCIFINGSVAGVGLVPPYDTFDLLLALRIRWVVERCWYRQALKAGIPMAGVARAIQLGLMPWTRAAILRVQLVWTAYGRNSSTTTRTLERREDDLAGMIEQELFGMGLWVPPYAAVREWCSVREAELLANPACIPPLIPAADPRLAEIVECNYNQMTVLLPQPGFLDLVARIETML